jgi:SAM-dependent methyltransferase
MIGSDSTARFSSRADAYAASRPSYPAAAIDALLRGLGRPQKLTVADIGAGTGIAARVLANRGVHICAIEPNAAMRAKASQHPLISWSAGTAEKTGLPDRAVDVSAAFQAFHWFDASTAYAEFCRVSRKRVAIVQYEREDRDPFTTAYSELVRRHATENIEERRAEALCRFAELAGAACQRSEHRYEQQLTREGMLGRLASTSYVPHVGAAGEALAADACAIFDGHAKDGHVSLALVCYVLFADV